MSKPEYVQIEANEDIPSVRDRLSFIRGKRVLLIWPEEGTALTRKLDLVLVQREATRKAIQLAIVTHDEAVISHADELNISTFETIRASEKARWKRGRTRAFMPRHHKPKDEPDPEDLMPVVSRVRSSRRQLSDAMRLAIRMIVIGAVIGTVLALVFIIMPTATVRLVPELAAVNVEVTITADANAFDIDVENNTIPATILQAPVQTVQQIATTGIQQVTDRQAVGVVTFTNTSTQRVTIPIGTQVSTSGSESIIFQTTIQESVAAGARVEVAVEALLEYSGEIGNVEPSTINTILGELSSQLEVINLRSMIGGTSETVHFVTEADREQLMRTVRGQLQSLAYTAMETQIDSDSQLIVIETVTIPEDGVRNDWITYSHEVGARSDTLALEMRAVVQALAIDDRFARQVVFARLSTEKPANLSLQPESFIYNRGPFVEMLNASQITFIAYGSGTALAQVDVPYIQQAVRGQSIPEAQAMIRNHTQLALDTEPQITIEPEWFGRLPLLPFRINVETAYDG